MEVVLPKSYVPRFKLHDIESRLSMFPQYADSRGVLYTTRGDVIRPVFQQALISGMAQNPAAWPAAISSDPSISARFANGELIELTSKQSQSAAEVIHAKLEEFGVHGTSAGAVSIQHICVNWLGGKVIRPLQPDLVASALSGISPGVSVLASPEFRKAYEEYIRLRVNLVHRCNQILFMQQNEQDGEGGARSQAPSQKRDATDICSQVEQMLNSLISDIGAFVSLQVASVHVGDFHAKGKGRQQETIVVPDTDEVPDVRHLPLETFDFSNTAKSARDLCITESLIYSFIRRFRDDNPDLFEQQHNSTNDMSDSRLLQGVKIALFTALESDITCLFTAMDRVREIGGTKKVSLKGVEFDLPEWLSIAAQRMADEISNGGFDKKYGMPSGFCRSIFNYETALRANLPANLFSAVMLQGVIYTKQKMPQAESPSLQSGTTKVNNKKLKKQEKKARREHRCVALIHELRELLNKNPDLREPFEQMHRIPTSKEQEALLACIGFGEAILPFRKYFDYVRKGELEAQRAQSTRNVHELLRGSASRR